MKKIITPLLKIILAFGIIYWLITSGKLDFNLLGLAFADKTRFFTSIALFIFVLFLVTYRYTLILRTRSNQIKMSKIFSLNWIGIFFNAVLPGSVSGDFLKIFYIGSHYPELSKKFLLGSIVVDRILGLFGLILSLGFFSLLNYSMLETLSSDIKTILYINFILLAAVLIGLFILIFTPSIISNLLSFFRRTNILKSFFEKLNNLWLELVRLKGKVIGLTLVSTLTQSLAAFIFWYITYPYADNTFDLSMALSLVPIGFLGIAIPIAPSGLGVGHALFQKIFEVIKITNGASLFNVYFFFNLLINLMGIIPYLRFSKKKTLKEIQNELS